LKAANLIRVALTDILQNKAKTLNILFSDAAITITKVQMTADLRNARCYFVPSFGLSKLDYVAIQKILDTYKKSIRIMLTSKIQLKYSPEVHFIYDSSFDNSKNIEDIFQQLNAEGKI
jgi:ribosome-binding factor A